MSVSTKSPTALVGGLIYSGGPHTGELLFNHGGLLRACVWSGTLGTVVTTFSGAVSSGGHVQFWTGVGRLNSVIQTTQMASGLPVYFYDAAAITLSGISVSGQTIIGVVPSTFAGGAWSGQGVVAWTGSPINVDVPFYSGLCAAVPSGSPGFTVTWTPEVIPPFVGGN